VARGGGVEAGSASPVACSRGPGRRVAARRRGCRGPTDGRGRPGDPPSPRPSGGSATGSTTELSAAPPTCPGPVHRPAVPPARLRVGRHLPPHFLYEALWTWLSRGAGAFYERRRPGQRPGPDCSPLRRRLRRGPAVWVESLRIDPATHVLGLRVNLWVSGLAPSPPAPGSCAPADRPAAVRRPRARPVDATAQPPSGEARVVAAPSTVPPRSDLGQHVVQRWSADRADEPWPHHPALVHNERLGEADDPKADAGCGRSGPSHGVGEPELARNPRALSWSSCRRCRPAHALGRWRLQNSSRRGASCGRHAPRRQKLRRRPAPPSPRMPPRRRPGRAAERRCRLADQRRVTNVGFPVRPRPARSPPTTHRQR